MLGLVYLPFPFTTRFVFFCFFVFLDGGRGVGIRGGGL